MSATRRSSGLAPRACVRVYARVLVPPNLYIHTFQGEEPLDTGGGRVFSLDASFGLLATASASALELFLDSALSFCGVSCMIGTVAAPPSIVVKCGGWFFVWSFVVLFLSGVCVCDQAQAMSYHFQVSKCLKLVNANLSFVLLLFRSVNV